MLVRKNFIRIFFDLANDGASSEPSTQIETNQDGTNIQTNEGNETNANNNSNKPDITDNSNLDIGDLNKKSNAKYISQLSKENQSLDLSDVPTIDDLVNHYVSTKESVILPKQNATEEQIKSFLKNIGVPEKADAYNIEQGNMSDEDFNNLKDIFKTEAFNAALSNAQATKIWNMIQGQYSAQNTFIQNMNEATINSFTTRMDDYLKDTEQILDASKREDIAKENSNLFVKFSKDNGFDDLFTKVGLNLNPEFINKMAKIQKVLENSTYIGSNSNTKDFTEKSFYSEDFLKEYGDS